MRLGDTPDWTSHAWIDAPRCSLRLDVAGFVAAHVCVAVDNHLAPGLIDQLQHLIQLIARPRTQIGQARIKQHIASKVRRNFAASCRQATAVTCWSPADYLQSPPTATRSP